MTQRWVQITGRLIDLEQMAWLNGPVGKPTGIGRDFFDELAADSDLEVRRNGTGCGLIANFSSLRSSAFDSSRVFPQVARFYERTSDYDLDVWAEWRGLFRPFGSLIASLFSRRLQQLNVPLSSLETSRGITSEIVQLADRQSGEIRYTAWVRQLIGSGHVLYAGSYSLCETPGFSGPCVKVVFPLPNGNAVVIMKPEAHADGSFSLTSSGRAFGDPGFYFVVHKADGRIFARYLRALRESIRVYTAEETSVRADHTLTLWGLTFLRLHYRLQEKSNSQTNGQSHV